MTIHIIKTSSELSDKEINTILKHWDVEEWKKMQADVFKSVFARSEFHFLVNKQSDILSLARINFDFHLKVGNIQYDFAEFVGFVSLEKGKGYGTQLLNEIIKSLQNRHIEAIGFCEKENRVFYQKAKVNILYDQAHYLREQENGKWITCTDDDILNLTLSETQSHMLESLNSERLGYIP
jgi:hypothetical protein